jgi:glycerate kinase
MERVRLLACPASLKGVLSAVEAAAALAEGARQVDGVDADEVPIADGGEGTAEVLAADLGGQWRTAEVSDPLLRPVTARYLVLDDGTAVVECAQAIGLPYLAPGERDPLRATSRGFGELMLAAIAGGATKLLVGLGGSATVDGGAGVREVIDGFTVPVQVACDVENALLGPRGAAHVFGPQKGASPEDVEVLEARLAAMPELAPFADLPGAGAAGGLGAALAALGAELLPGGPLVLDTIGFRDRVRDCALAVTGEGTVDRTTAEGKAPGTAFAYSRDEGVRCVVFGGLVVEPLPGAETRALSGLPERAREDLVELGERLALALLDGA